MGFRHLVVVDGNLFVVGMITRSDMNEHRLEHFWQSEASCYSFVLVLIRFPYFISGN